jgi:hypothetical protein
LNRLLEKGSRDFADDVAPSGHHIQSLCDLETLGRGRNKGCDSLRGRQKKQFRRELQTKAVKLISAKIGRPSYDLGSSINKKQRLDKGAVVNIR